MKVNPHSPYFMVICMILAGYASTMNNWIDSYDDFRFSINDTYMVGLMTGWMLFFMGLFTFTYSTLFVGILLVAFFFMCIRNQYFVDETQYLQGMIPHHSMAILMSKRLQTKPNTIQPLLQQIIKSQQEEIVFMKQRLASMRP